MSLSIRAVPATWGASGATAPRRVHGARSTRPSFRTRFTLPLSPGVQTSRSAPSGTTHTGVATAAPVFR